MNHRPRASQRRWSDPKVYGFFEVELGFLKDCGEDCGRSRRRWRGMPQQQRWREDERLGNWGRDSATVMVGT